MNHIDSSRLRVLNQPLNAGALEIRSRVAVVDVSVDLVPAPLQDIPLKQELLRADLSRINSPENMTFCPEQFTCHKNMVTCPKKDVNTCNMNEIGIY